MMRWSVALLWFALAGAAPQQPARIGDTYELLSDRESSFTVGGNGNGSSTDRDATIERVVGVSDAGLELEYDLPKDTPADERDPQWQFPVRVVMPSSGPLQLLNAPEIAARADRWLKRAKLPRTACGHYYFTWNVFRIECDPQSVLAGLEAIDLRRIDLREGGSYRDRYAVAPASFKRITAGSDVSFVAEMAIDPDHVRRDLAQADVATGEIMRKPVTYDEALRKAQDYRISGTIRATFDVDRDGDVKRRTTVTMLEISKPGEAAERRTTTEMLDRRLVAHGKP